ncbi:hypothetical protein ACQEV4_31370 [Streptomyces shenzhenensis]|uniref:hypothetical protein n=1 Tax=Streptomyces shenzhenensis TaxID=943815 RepID=UPI003D8E53AC
MPGQQYNAEDVRAYDEAGDINFLTGSTAPGGSAAFFTARTFTPDRATVGELTLTYRAAITPARSPRRPGPSYELRNIDGGLAGAFASFVLLPTDLATPLRLTVEWDLRTEDARGFTTRGPNDFTTELTVRETLLVFLIAGQVHTLPAQPGAAPFNAYWIGEPPFAVEEAMRWCATAHEELLRLFAEPDPAPYHFMLRPHPNPRDGGAATTNGFMLEYGTGAHTESARRYMFLHEMVHHFTGTFDGPIGTGSWYSEGLAEFYKIRVAEGLLDRASHQVEVETMTASYYRNPFRALPYVEVPALYWANSHAQGIPYNRGFMYFTDLDTMIRDRSDGRRSVHDLVLAMIEDRRAGRPYDEGAWRAKLFAELGESGIAHLENMLAGKTIVPSSGAFGADLIRVRRSTPVAQLGFSDRSLTHAPTAVTGLDPHSSAAAAGLREGDEVTGHRGVERQVLHSAGSLVLGPEITIDVVRDGRPLRFSYVPDEVTVEEYVWQSVDNGPVLEPRKTLGQAGR